MTGAIACTIVTGIAVPLRLYFKRSGVQPVGGILKMVASCGFLGVALFQGAADHRFGQVLLVGLVLAWLGDLFLISRQRRWFLLGLVSFLLGHVAYVAAFWVRGVDPMVAALAILPVGTALLVVGRWLLPQVDPRMHRPVLAYMLVISAMVVLAAGTTAHTPAWLLLPGAFAFYLSDLSVARDRFVQQSWGNLVWGQPLYFGGQLLLAWSV